MAAAPRDHVPYYLRKGPSGSVTSLNDGALSTEKPAAGEAATSYTYPDWEWVNGVAIIGPDGRVDPVRRVLTFTSAPLEADLEVTGPIVLELYASSSAIDTQFIVKLTDQHPQDAAARAKGEQPAYTPVSKGWLKASHREKDPQRSTPTRPFYTHTNPQPITPGEIYQFDIEVLPISYVFKKGHRIRLELANGDSPATDGVFSHPYHPTLMGTDTIHHDGAHASCLLLPVMRRVETKRSCAGQAHKRSSVSRAQRSVSACERCAADTRDSYGLWRSGISGAPLAHSASKTRVTPEGRSRCTASGTRDNA